MSELYTAFLAELRGRRAKLEAELKDVDVAIDSILRLSGMMDSGVAPPHVLTVSQSSPLEGQSQATPRRHTRFANISVRWAVLWHLAEDVQGFEKTGEIASALRAGGYRTEATNFGNMVSAVLSTMKGKQEVESSDDGYCLTDSGRQTWALIKQGTKFRAATFSSEPSPLSVQ